MIYTIFAVINNLYVHRYLHHIALILLLLFVRAMVPDALLLELHHHTHTVDAHQTDHHKAQVAGKHVHCPIEDLFGAPYQGSLLSFEAAPPAAHVTTHTNAYQSKWHKSAVAYTCLRGPPSA